MDIKKALIIIAGLSFLSFDLKLNEIMANPNKNEKEWIEILNPHQVDLSNYLIEEQLGSGNPSDHKIGEGIATRGVYFIYEFNQDRLNNDKDTIKLKDENGVVIDEFSFTTTSKGKSFARIPDGSIWQTTSLITKGEINAIFQTPTLSPTPAQNSTTPQTAILATQLPQGIYLNELMPCPKTNSPEWLEIFNSNSNTVNLDQWLIKDGSGKKIKLEGSINAHDYLVIEMENSIFNNVAGDQVILEAVGKQMDRFEYTTCQSGVSWSKVNGSWCQSEATQGQSNHACLPEPQATNTANPTKSPAQIEDTLITAVEPKFVRASVVQENAIDRQLPKLMESSASASLSATVLAEVAGVATSAAINPEPSRPQTLAIAIASVGAIMITAAGYPWYRPYVLKIFRGLKTH